MNSKNSKRAQAVFDSKIGKVKSGKQSGWPLANKNAVAAKNQAKNIKMAASGVS